LDNLGDPGIWLENVLGGEWEDILFGESWDDERRASEMAEDYVEVMMDRDVEPPSDFGDDPKYQGWTGDDTQLVKDEFVAFIRRWREVVVDRLEKQCLQPPGAS
jgi:hypothetical protein